MPEHEPWTEGAGSPMDRRDWIATLGMAVAGTLAGCATGAGAPPGAPRASADIRDFGAVGDGTTDDLPALQRAVDSAPPGGAVRIRAGTYRLGGPLLLRSHVSVVGEGKASLLVVDHPNVHVLTAATRGLEGVRIASLALRGSRRGLADGNGGSGVALYDARRCTVENVFIEDVGTAGIDLRECHACLVRNCAVVRGGDNSMGIWVRSDFDRALANVITGNRVDGMDFEAIEIAGARGTVVSGNELTGSGVGLALTGVAPGDAGIIAVDNHITDCHLFGIELRRGAAGNLLALNRIEDAGGFAEGHGIGISNADGATNTGNTFWRNRIERPGGDGIFVGSSSQSLVENQVFDAAGSGIRVDARACRVLGNELRHARAHGIHLAPGAREAVVVDNTAAANDGWGIFRELDAVTLAGNHLAGNRSGEVR